MIIEYLEKIHQEIYKEKLELEQIYHKKEQLIKENNQFILALKDSMDCNYESFSPRDINHGCLNKIESVKEELQVLEKQNGDLSAKILNLDEHLMELESILKFCREREKSAGEQQSIMEEDEIFRQKILETQELERQRIARDLHDSIVQNLTNMIHKIEICSKLIDMDKVRCKLELQAMSENVRLIIDDMRRVIYDLRPMSLDDIGLSVTVERELFKIKNEGNIYVEFHAEGQEQKLQPFISLTILRIVQEACNNIIKHSHASNIEVSIKYTKKQVEVKVTDNGIGFDLESIQNLNRKDGSGFGISMMKERVYLLSGKLKIESKPGKGTKIIVKVPINKEDEE